MKIDILLPTSLKNKKLLDKCLESINKCNIPTNFNILLLIIINNNNDRIEEKQYTTENKISIKILKIKEIGKNSALNYGIKNTNGKIIICFDDDIIIHKNYFINLEKHLIKWPNSVAYGGCVTLKWSKNKSHKIDKHIIQYIKGYAFGSLDLNIDSGIFPLNNMLTPLGNNMIFRRSYLPSQKPFNPKIGPSGKTYRMGGSAELFRLYHNKNYEIIYLSDVSVQHHVRPEQLDVSWILKRSFSWGRSVGYYKNNYRGIDGNASLIKLLLLYGIRSLRIIYTNFKKEKYPKYWAKIDIEIIKGILFEKFNT